MKFPYGFSCVSIVTVSFVFLLSFSPAIYAQTSRDTEAACSVVGSNIAASAQQRLAAAKRVKPKGVVGPTGFDWPDTQLGVVRSRDGKDYLFFASDGSCHGHCDTSAERDGSFTRSIGTLDNPLGSGSPITEAILPQSSQLSHNAIIYVGAGPVYRVPAGHPGAGNLLLAYQAARNTNLVTHTGMYGFLGLAKSTDEGMTWTDLGLFIGANQPYNPKAKPTDNDYDIGNGNFVADPTETYFYIYFPDKIKPSGTSKESVNTFLSVARVKMDEFLSAAFSTHAPDHMPAFTKYYNGQWSQPGIGGLSSMVLPGPWPPYAGDPYVAYNEFLHRYFAILDDNQRLSYSESKDGVLWSTPVLLKTSQGEPISGVGAGAVVVGKEKDPSRLGQQFYIYFTYYPTDGTGWDAATLRRLTVSCK